MLHCASALMCILLGYVMHHRERWARRALSTVYRSVERSDMLYSALICYYNVHARENMLDDLCIHTSIKSINEKT